MKKLFCFMAAAAFATGCSETVNDETAAPDFKTGRTVAVTLVNATRTTLEYPDGDFNQPSKLVWSTGDKVSYFTSGADGSWTTSKSADVNENGTFTISDAPEGDFTVRVVYPNVQEGLEYAHGVVSAKQNQATLDRFGGSDLPMWGEGAVAAGADTATVPYTVDGSVIRLKLTSGKYSSEVVKKVVLYSPDGTIADSSNTITLTMGSTISATLSQSRYFYIVTMAGEYDLKVTVVTDVAEYGYTATFGSQRYDKANMYRFALNLDDADKVERTEATPLDTTGTANCYIVSESGIYTFNADICGSGIGTDGQVASTITEAGKSYDAAWLWQTNEGGVITDDVVYDEASKRIRITVPEPMVPGSAIVALYETDSRNIVWSWHIWVNNLVKEEEYPTSGTWLNMNIGAITNNVDDASSYGFLYQWGRKDPIVGSGLAGSKADTKESEAFSAEYTAKTVVNEMFNDMSWKLVDGSATTAEAGSQPMSLFAEGINDTNANMWLGPASAYKKVMYDPCPLGYKMPTASNMTALKNDLPAGTMTLWEQTNGRTYTTTNGVTVYLPAAGARLGGSTYNNLLSRVGFFGYYWSSAASNNGNFFKDGAITVNGAGSGNASALPIRCRKGQ